MRKPRLPAADDGLADVAAQGGEERVEVVQEAPLDLGVFKLGEGAREARAGPSCGFVRERA